ncbi:hypothetical protein AGMMS50256_38940 [Betaproteobacteria bacterium]|nr:hypothetical protein AGMMS50256_38940 [Betaproteobacteria bacterium]
MKVRELIKVLNGMPQESTVYVAQEVVDFSPLVVEVVEAQRMESQALGVAVLLETEEL